MTLIEVGASLALFFVVARLLRITELTLRMFGVSRSALRSLRDPSLSDEQKEALARRASGQLLGGFLNITTRASLALALAAAPFLASLSDAHSPHAGPVRLWGACARRP